MRREMLEREGAGFDFVMYSWDSPADPGLLSLKIGPAYVESRHRLSYF